MLPGDEEVKNTVRIAQKMKRVLGTDRLPLSVELTAQSKREDIEVLYDAGLAGVNFDLEIFNRKYFEAVCPGKANVQGYDGWIQGLKWAVEIFGKGRVSSAITSGIEPLEYTFEGFEFLADMGVIPTTGGFMIRPGAKYQFHRSPDLDFCHKVAEKVVELWFKYDLFDVSKPRSCLFRCTFRPIGDPKAILCRMFLKDPDWEIPQLPPLNSLRGKTLAP